MADLSPVSPSGAEIRVTHEVRLTITGAPRTKKNSRVHTKRGVPLPSKAWRGWLRRAVIVDAKGRRLMGLVHCGNVWAAVREGDSEMQEPLREPLNICATFYRDALRGDAVGFYQGLADLLEKRGVIANDSQLVSWDGSRLLLDRGNPRVEILLSPSVPGDSVTP